jgi:hypothetical protein
MAFHVHVAYCGYVGIDFYDGSIMYDFENEKAVICDIDFYAKALYVNHMGRLWGSGRFMSPEEFTLNAAKRYQRCKKISLKKACADWLRNHPISPSLYAPKRYGGAHRNLQSEWVVKRRWRFVRPFPDFVFWKGTIGKSMNFLRDAGYICPMHSASTKSNTAAYPPPMSSSLTNRMRFV